MSSEEARDRPADPERSEGGVRAVFRALDILSAFAPGDRELLVSELLRRLDLSRPTLYRLLDTLVAKDFLVSVGEPQRFRLGPAVARLAHAWSSGLDHVQVAEPMMRRLWQATRETVSLHVLDGSDRLCVSEMVSPQPLSFRRGVGFREKLAVGASGRCILAWLHPGAPELPAFGGPAGPAAQAMLEKLAAVRQAGFAVSRDELIQGAVAVAAPFFDANGRVAGSLGLFGPSVRLGDEAVRRHGELLLEEASRLTQALGGQPPVPTPDA